MRPAPVFPLLVAAAIAFGCGARQQNPAGSSSVQQLAARPLPFKGRLDSAEPSQVPPAVAASLSDSSLVTFSYREELTHDEYHIPLIFTALDPVTYMGAPLGDFGVTASGSLWITEGGRILGEYSAKARVLKYYTIYSQPTHRELDDAAVAEVRERIDEKLYRDADRLAAAIAASGKAPGASSK